MCHRVSARVASVALALGLVVACGVPVGKRAEAPGRDTEPTKATASEAPSASAQDSPADAEAGAAPPPQKESELIPGAGTFAALEVEGFLPAVVWVPRGASPKPLLVATHGATGRPEPHCERWQQLIGDRAFALCVRGAKTNRRDPLETSRHYYPDHKWLGRAVKANLQALVAAYGEHVDVSRAVYAGYSQGAVMGALMLMDELTPFSRMLFIEGQQDDFSVHAAQRLARAGADKVALVCGLGLCAEAYTQSASRLRRGGIAVRLEYAAGAGHTYDGAVGERVTESLEWLIADDARWR